MEASNQQTTLLPNSSTPVLLPVGWTVYSSDPLTFTGPEGDLNVSLSVTAEDLDIETLAHNAWLQVDSAFNHPVVQQTELPSSTGWDKVSQLIYRTPSDEGKSAIAILRTLNRQAYILLIHGSKAGLSRRMAQATEILQAWKPTNLKSPSLVEQQPVLLGSTQAAQLKQFVTEAMQSFQIPGVSICIVQKSRVVFSQGFGIRKIGSSEAVTPGTRFMIGSSTKPLTTLMMARLVDQGALSWTTPVTSLLPDFALGDAEMTRRLQLRHTVCACTGMPRRDIDFVFRFKGISPEQRLAEMKTMRPTTGFGETFQYSNLLVAVGGYVAGRVHRPASDLAAGYEAAMQDLLFKPLGMDSTCLGNSQAATGNAAAPHAIDMSGSAVPIDPSFELTVESVAPAGAVWSTAEDMAKYVSLELAGGTTSDGATLLSRETLESRWRGGIKIDDQTSYGLGLMQGHEHGLEIMSHPGNTFGFTSDMFFLPTHDIGVVILTNLRVANTFLGIVRERLFELLFGAEPKAQNMLTAALKFTQDAAERVRERVKIDAASIAWLEDWVGDYWSEDLGPARIGKERDQFQVRFESWGSALGVETEPNGDRLIVLTSPPLSGTFRFRTDVATRAISVNAGQSVHRFERIAAD